MSKILFISDLHLSRSRPHIIDLFIRFIEEIAVDAEKLYILGDLLEYWIGDDDASHKIDNVFSSLQKLSASGVSVYFMHGNRDFLVGSELARLCEFELLEDPAIHTFHDEPVLLMHGDTLCTDDKEYQKFRKMVRNQQWQKEFLSKTLDERVQTVDSLREISKEAVANKPPEIMDVNQDEVIHVMQTHNVKTMIHGHTHRLAVHDFEIDGNDVRRIVLGDWYETGNYLQIDNDADFELIQYN